MRFDALPLLILAIVGIAWYAMAVSRQNRAQDPPSEEDENAVGGGGVDR